MVISSRPRKPIIGLTGDDSSCRARRTSASAASRAAPTNVGYETAVVEAVAAMNVSKAQARVSPKPASVASATTTAAVRATKPRAAGRALRCHAHTELVPTSRTGRWNDSLRSASVPLRGCRQPGIIIRRH